MSIPIIVAILFIGGCVAVAVIFLYTQRAKKISNYKFTVREAICAGDYYEYHVQANSREEAFRKLVEYFYGVNKGIETNVKSIASQFTIPGYYRFDYYGMPEWFAKRISGYARENGIDYQQKLEEYCLKNNIKIKD